MFGVIELAMTTKNVAKMGETAQQMSQSTQRAGRIFNGYLAEAQEINTEFARRATETWIEAIRNQTELNQRMVQRLYGEVEGQTGAWQGFLQDWMSVYSAPFSNRFGSVNPFDYLRQGVETTARNVEQVTDMTQKTTVAGIASANASANGGFPIAGYDEMNVEEVSARLEGLSEDQLKRVREHEKRNKNRDTLIEQIDRKIKAATA
jgi:hypothetical protein